MRALSHVLFGRSDGPPWVHPSPINIMPAQLATWFGFIRIFDFVIIYRRKIRLLKLTD